MRRVLRNTRVRTPWATHSYCVEVVVLELCANACVATPMHSPEQYATTYASRSSFTLQYSTVLYNTLHRQTLPATCSTRLLARCCWWSVWPWSLSFGSCPAAHQWMGCSKKMRTTVLQPTFWICNVVQYITVQYSTVFCKDTVRYFTVLYSTGNNSEYSAVRFTTGKAVLCLRIVWGRLQLVHWILPNGRRLIVLIHILSAWWLHNLQEKT